MSSKILKSSDLDKKLESKEGPVGPSYIHTRGVIRKEELQAQGRAEALLAEAAQAAKQIREEALQLKAKVERELEKAKREGFEEGREEGLEALTRELLKARELKEQFYAQAEGEVIRLVIDIADKVIGQMAERHTEAIQSIVQQALEKALGDRIVIRLHPEDYQRLKDLEPSFREKLERTRHLYFKEDDAVQKGGCIVETEIGTIDAQLDTQMKAIKKAFGV